MEQFIPALPIDKIKESSANPRKYFDAAALEELAQSIRAKGVLHPILVRPGDDGHFELVFGHRRIRAAKKAGLETIPATVRELSDQEVLEAQIIENCSRVDIHPLEEAEGYRQLHEKHGYSIEDLAAKVGRSKAYVYARLKLGAMPPAAQKLFYEGKLNPSTALLIARIPNPGLAEKAAKEIARPRHGGPGGPMSTRDAFDHIQRHYMLRLSEAPFATADAQLYPQAGSCTSCSRRTGNQAELFSDIKSADVCTDPPCFRRKADLAWKARKEEAEKAGQRVLSEQEVKKVFPYQNYHFPSHVSGLTDLSHTCYDDPKLRTYGQLLGKHAPAPTLARDPGGKVHELLPQKELRAALKRAGVKLRQEKTGSSSGLDKKERERRRKEREKGLLGEAVAKLARPQLIEVARKRQLQLDLIRIVVREMGRYSPSAASEKQIAKAGDGDLAGMLVERLLLDCDHCADAGLFSDLCRLYHIDTKTLEADLLARKCEGCGCTTLQACPGGCSWVTETLCSACDKKAKKKGKTKK